MANKKTLLVLLLLCFLLITVLLTSQHRQSVNTEQNQSLFLPKLNEKLSEVSKILVDAKQQSQSVVLKNENGQWLSPDKDNYPVDTAQIRQFLYGLSNLKIVDKKTSNEQLLSEIGLAENDAQSTRVRLFTGSDKSVVDILFGQSKNAMSGQGRDWFVRHTGEQQSWLANARLSILTSPVQWLDNTVLQVSQDQITQVVVNPQTAAALTINKSENGQGYELLEGNDDEHIQAHKLEQIISSASWVQFDDVRVNSQAEPTDAAVKISLQTVDDILVSMLISEPEHAWVNLSANTPSDDPETIAKVNAMNANWENWQYQLPQYQMTNLLQTKQDLILDPEASEN